MTKMSASKSAGEKATDKKFVRLFERIVPEMKKATEQLKIQRGDLVVETSKVEAVMQPVIDRSKASFEVARDLCARLVGDGRRDDARDVWKIMEGLHFVVKAFMDATRASVNASHEGAVKALDAANIAYDFQLGVLDGLQEVRRRELEERRAANSGRNGERKSKHQHFRDAVTDAVVSNPSLTFGEAMAICEAVRTAHKVAELPSEKTVYNWLPARRKPKSSK